MEVITKMVNYSIKMNDIELSFFEKNGKNPLNIIFLHPLGERKESFEQMLPYFEKYNCYGIDFRGHGDTDSKGPFTIKRLVEDIKEFMELKGISEAFFIASSISGWIMQSFCSEYPNRVHGVVLLDSGYYLPKNVPGAELSNIENPIFNTEHELVAHVQEEIDNLHNYDVSLDFSAAKTLNKFLIENYKFDLDTKSYKHKTNNLVMNEFNKELMQYNFEKFNSEIPFLLLLADSKNIPEEIKSYFDRSLNKFCSEIKKMEIHTINNSHHLLMLTNPKETSNHILKFINELTS